MPPAGLRDTGPL